MNDAVEKAFAEKAFGKPTLIPKFFMHPSKDKRRSEQHGMNVYNETLFVQIKTKGRKDITSRKATTDDTQLFSHAYDIFTSINSEHELRLEILRSSSNALIYALRDLDILTVSELANTIKPMPLAGLKAMRFEARTLIDLLDQIVIPEFYDDEVQNEERIVQPQRHNNGQDGDERHLRSLTGSHEGGDSPTLGVNFSDSGERTFEVNGKAIQEKSQQEEGQQEESQQKVKPLPF